MKYIILVLCFFTFSVNAQTSKAILSPNECTVTIANKEKYMCTPADKFRFVGNRRRNFHTAMCNCKELPVDLPTVNYSTRHVPVECMIDDGISADGRARITVKRAPSDDPNVSPIIDVAVRCTGIKKNDE